MFVSLNAVFDASDGNYSVGLSLSSFTTTTTTAITTILWSFV